jgi:hypothetical protein
MSPKLPPPEIVIMRAEGNASRIDSIASTPIAIH